MKKIYEKPIVEEIVLISESPIANIPGTGGGTNPSIPDDEDWG